MSIQEIVKKIKVFLTSAKLKKLAKEQKMIIRERKITAKSVTKATLLASIKDEGTSLELMASLFEQDDIDITKQSLHAKINQHAVGFMKAVFDKLCELLIGNLANTISTKFKDILIVDSSEIKLNRGLAELYKSTRNGARCKLQAIYRLLSKNLQCDITKANKNDQGYKGYLDRVTQGDLVIFDLGYFALESFKTIMSKGGYVVARLLRGTTIMNINKEKIDIEKLLKTSSGDVDMMILLGEKSQLACRLIAHKLTGEALIKRQEKLRREAKKSGKKKVQQVCTEIDNWSIYTR